MIPINPQDLTSVFQLATTQTISTIFQIAGPEFTTPATQLSPNASPNEIWILEVFPGNGAPQIQTLPPAVGILRNYFVEGAAVVLYLPARLVEGRVITEIRAALGTQRKIQVVVGNPRRRIAFENALLNRMERGWQRVAASPGHIFEIQQAVLGAGTHGLNVSASVVR